MKHSPFSRLLPLLAAFLILYACDAVPKADDDNTDSKIGASSVFNLEAVRDTIEAANAVFIAAMLKGDSVTAGNGYTTDAKTMGANAPAVNGREAIISMIAKDNFPKNGIKGFEVHTIDIWGDSNMVIEEGTWRLKDGEGKTIDNGKYIGIWKKEDGKWKLFRDIGNSDNPPKTANTQTNKSISQ